MAVSFKEITVSRNGYEATVLEATSRRGRRVGAITTGKGSMPDAAELRRQAEFLLALACVLDGHRGTLTHMDFTAEQEVN